MKKVNVIVKDKTTIELLEDASAGDIIDLKEIVKIDTSYIENLIESNKDGVYNNKLETERNILNSNHELEINKLKNEMELMKLGFETKEKTIEQKLKEEKNIEIKIIEKAATEKYHELEQKYHELSSIHNSEIEKTKLEVEKNYLDKINGLERENELLKVTNSNTLESQKNNLELEKEKEIQKVREKYEEILKEKEETINRLQRSKAVMNVKQTGEDLESWCNNEVLSYMQNGLFNCTWEKDNLVVRDTDEQKGSKADYIFKIYANNKHNENEILASICLDMKDENPDSVTKKKNADHYKQLENNRIKKNCKYSVLVSNLEIDRPNDLPIFKVREYENMYVVRPAYLMVFLNMITSLTTRFSDIIQNDEKETLALKNKYDLIEEFNSIKNTYLDKPLESLNTAIDAILKSSTAIRDASKKIDDSCERIKRSYILEIEEKINKFELKLNKTIVKKLD